MVLCLLPVVVRLFDQPQQQPTAAESSKKTPRCFWVSVYLLRVLLQLPFIIANFALKWAVPLPEWSRPPEETGDATEAAGVDIAAASLVVLVKDTG